MASDGSWQVVTVVWWWRVAHGSGDCTLLAITSLSSAASPRWPKSINVWLNKKEWGNGFHLPQQYLLWSFPHFSFTFWLFYFLNFLPFYFRIFLLFSCLTFLLASTLSLSVTHTQFLRVPYARMLFHCHLFIPYHTCSFSPPLAFTPVSSSISHPASHHPLRSVIVCKRFEREGIPSECKRTCRRFRLPMKLILVKMNSSIMFPFFKLSISTHTFCKTSSLSVDVDLTWLFPPLCFRGGRAGEAEEANRLAQKVRVLCWVMTQPASHDKKAVHVKATWGRRCNKLIFISSKNSKLYVVFYFV